MKNHWRFLEPYALTTIAYWIWYKGLLIYVIGLDKTDAATATIIFTVSVLGFAIHNQLKDK